MIPEWMLGTLLDYAKDGVIAGIDQKDYDSILDRTLSDFESKYFGFSKTEFKRFTDSPEFQTHLEQHLTDRELDLEYLGGILSEYVNLENCISGKTLLRDFYDKFEINLCKNPKLKDQLDLKYHRSAEGKLTIIQESSDELKHNQKKTLELLECLVQQGIQKSDHKLCLRGYNLSEDQILKIAENALKSTELSYEKGLSLIILGKIN